MKRQFQRCRVQYTRRRDGNGRWALGVVALIIASSAVLAQQPQLEAENLLFSPPKDFKIGWQKSQGQSLWTEWIPSGQTVEDWTDMLTVQIYRGAKIDAPAFLQDVGKRYVNDCPETTAKGIFTGQTNGYVVSMLLLRCPKNPKTGKPETTAFRIIKGTDALYSVQYAWRSLPSEQDVKAAMAILGKATVCDTRDSSHPCPKLDAIAPAK